MKYKVVNRVRFFNDFHKGSVVGECMGREGYA